jgi:HEAT repeat protein
MAGLVAIVWPRDVEPVYQGKKLSRWLELYNGGIIEGSSVDQIHEAKEAIHAMGSNAVPCLLKWGQYRTPLWRTKLADLAHRLPGNPNLGDVKAYRAAVAWQALSLLGPEARSAVPELTRLVNDPNAEFSYREPLYALGEIGEDGLPPLLAVLADPKRSDRGAAALIIGGMKNLGTNRVRAVVLLIQCLADPREMEAGDAANALGRLRMEPDLVVPALTNCLSFSSLYVRCFAVRSLGRFGKEARPAVPSLVASLSDPDAAVREFSTNALQEIAPEMLQTNSSAASSP